MKIIHAPIEIAGQMGILCDALLEQGHQAIGYNYFRTYLGYDEHIVHSDLFEIGQLSNEIIPYFDLFHFHYASTLLPDYKDLELIKQTAKPAVMHHWGNDVRTEAMAGRHNPYVYTGDSPPSETIDARLRQISLYISTAIVQDFEVYPYVKPYYDHVHVLPLAIKLADYQPSYPNPSNKRPLVVHAPTNPEFKGTQVIEEQVRLLQKEIPFDYQRVEWTDHRAAVQRYRQADIVIDQILCGSFGQLSVESMALGKPVLVYIRPDLKHVAEKPPVCNAHPDNFYVQLKALLLSGELRYERGRQGRQYVERVHDHRKVGQQLLKIYAQLTG